MKIRRLSIQNFYSYGTSSINLADRGLLLVEGRNKDTGGSNGAGKSALFEAMCFGLFGKTLRYGASLSEVSRNGNGDTCVYHEIELDVGTLLVYRHRDHSKYGNKALCYLNGKDLTRGSDAETQKVINDYLQLDFETFCSVVMFPQDAAGFSSLNDASQKAILESVLGTRRFSLAQERAKEHLKKVQSALSSIKATIAELGRSAEDQKRNLDVLRGQEARFKVEKETKIQEIQERLASFDLEKPVLPPTLLQEYQSAKAEAFNDKVAQARQLESHSKRRIQETQNEIAKVQGIIEVLQSDLSNFPSEAPPPPEQSLETLYEEYHRISSQKTRLEGVLSVKQIELSSIESVLRNIDRLTECDKCGQPLSQKAKQNMLGSSGVQRSQLISEISKITKALTEMSSDVMIAESLYSNAQSYAHWEEGIQKSKDLSVRTQELDCLNGRISLLTNSLNSVCEILQHASHNISKTESLGKQIADIEAAQKMWESQKRQLEKDLSEKSAQSSPYEELIVIQEAAIKATESVSRRKLATLSELELQEESLQFWVNGFSNRGVKSLLLDSVTPMLTRAASEYLSFLTDGAATLQFNTQTELKSGEKREKFNVSVSYKFGAKTYAGVSGGERQRVDTATLFALGDLAATRASAPVKLRLLDESFCYMDAYSIEALVTLLKEKVVPKCGTCLVMTHSDDLKALFDDHIVVVKESGISRIEDPNDSAA